MVLEDPDEPVVSVILCLWLQLDKYAGRLSGQSGQLHGPLFCPNLANYLSRAQSCVRIYVFAVYSYDFCHAAR